MNILIALLALGAGDPDSLPRSLAETEPAPATTRAGADDVAGWYLGPRVGYLDGRDSGSTWLIGAQLRWRLSALIGFEASIEYHNEDYNSGDINVSSIPIQASAMIFLPVDWSIRPYAVGGVGIYTTRTRFSGSLSSESDETNREFGFHLGFGVDWILNPSLVLDVDFRYLWINEPPHFGDNNSDALEITVGLNFKL
jgi:opacity protein-like surface antigen